MKIRTTDKVLEAVYESLINDSVDNFDSIHIPRSDVFYARQAYFDYSGDWVTLDRMERAMWAEGMLESRDVLEPSRERTFEGKYTY